jgi:hypothetical protein
LQVVGAQKSENLGSGIAKTVENDFHWPEMGGWSGETGEELGRSAHKMGRQPHATGGEDMGWKPYHGKKQAPVS